MSHPSDEETDRAVSRRVEHDTAAEPGDQDVYAAASREPDPDAAGALPSDGGGTAERAAAEPAGDEPTRSE